MFFSQFETLNRDGNQISASTIPNIYLSDENPTLRFQIRFTQLGGTMYNNVLEGLLSQSPAETRASPSGYLDNWKLKTFSI